MAYIQILKKMFIWICDITYAYLGIKVLARNSKMPVQNSNFKISARPDLATNLLQIIIPATINSLVCQKGQFTLKLCSRRWFVKKVFGYCTPKYKIEISS